MSRMRVILGDITTMEVDAVVNAANAWLRGGGGVDGAIHAAGGPAILAACRQIVEDRGPLAPGEAAITGAGRLRAAHVIHTVGPIWGEEPSEVQDGQLASCYSTSLELAEAHQARTVAFPNIGTGVYGFPKERAAHLAVDAVSGHLSGPGNVTEVVFVCFDQENHALYHGLLDG